MKIHFIGIGGIGVSSLAGYFLAKGDKVTGSDMTESELTRYLIKKGVDLKIGPHSAKNIEKGTDLVIHTPAVGTNNPEIREAKKKNIEVLSYPEALGRLTKNHFTIAVSGTHGKSTTTAMLALILIEARLDPTVIIGTKLKEFGGSNFRMGHSKYLLIEADEYKESFLNYHPKMIVLTNIDNDHLDYYGSIEKIIKAFKRYFKNLQRNGHIIANGDDMNTITALKGEKKVKYYSLKNDLADNIRKVLKVPGEHNVSNALAVHKTALTLGLDSKETIASLSKYKGSWRRFEIFRTGYKNIILISDYAHHPTEVEKTLKAAREKYRNRRIKCVFQPHQYKRTQYLFDDFAAVLKDAPVEEIVLSEIYGVAGREEKGISKKVNSRKLALAAGSKVIYKKTIEEAGRYLKKNLKGDDLIVIMGAGDIYDLFIQMKKFFLTKKKNKKIITYDQGRLKTLNS